MTATKKLAPEYEGRIPSLPAICDMCRAQRTRVFRKRPSVLVMSCVHSGTLAAVDLEWPRPIWRASGPWMPDEMDGAMADAAAFFLHAQGLQSE